MEKRMTKLQALNPHLSLFSVLSEAFRPYGRILKGYDFNEVMQRMKQTDIPAEGNIYLTSVKHLEQTAIKRQLQQHLYGGMEIQIGYCNGRNSNLNGLEYHKGSEINVAVTDLVLLLGKVQDIRNNKYSTEHIQAFFLPQGTAVELYQTTLHFAPCKVTDDGFKCIVVLPKGTNEPLEHKSEVITEEDELLFMTNKWLLAHPERKILIDRGAYPGIVGDNILMMY